MNTLHELFLHKLSELYDAENQITAALPKMMDMATDEELKTAFSEHLDQTKNHIVRLEQIAASLNADLKRKENKVMKTLIEEGEKVLKEVKASDVLDAALIAAAQKVEHYEIASYGTAATWASVMEHDEEKDLLGETLEEEKATDKKLSGLAEGGLMTKGINEDAHE